MDAARGQGTAEAVAADLVRDFDWESFEFGSAPGEPQPEALQFLLAAGYRTGVAHAARVAVVGLDALVKSEAFDSVEGGFFAACRTRGWREPETAKPLALNASMVVALSLAWVATGREDFDRARAETIGWMERSLARAEDDLWSRGQEADPEYYEFMAHARSGRRPPAADPEVDVEACARAVSAFAAAGACWGDRSLVGRARLALQALIDRAVGPDFQVAEALPVGARGRGTSARAAIAVASATLDVLCVSRDPSLEPVLGQLLEAVGPAPGAGGAVSADARVLALRAAARAGRAAPRWEPPAPPDPLPRARAAHGLAALAGARGVIRVEGVAGSALCTGAVARCLPFGPVVVGDWGNTKDEENRVVVRAGRAAATEVRRRSELDGVGAALGALASPSGRSVP
jgi:hypothetical protein